jgi:FemAB-related protein (PEP-CTERM system-associated)
LVEPLAPDRRQAWDEFVRQHPDGTFFHLSAWSGVLERAFGHRSHYLLARRGDRLCGVLPLAEVKSLLFGHALVSTPFCVYGGVVAADADAHLALIERASTLARELAVDHLELRNRSRQLPDWPCRDQYVTFRKAMSADAEANLKAIPNRQRAMIRKGAKNGLAASLDDGPERHYAAYAASLRNLGTPVFTARYTAILMETFGRDCEVLTVTRGAEVVASVLSFYFRDEVLPYYGGGTAAARALAANDFMYWEVMERARARGCRLFDYGRSKRDSGAFHFKRYWGFEPETLHYEYLLVRARKVPNLSPTNAKYQALIGLWRRMPLPLTRVLGPPLAKHLG